LVPCPAQLVSVIKIIMFEEFLVVLTSHLA